MDKKWLNLGKFFFSLFFFSAIFLSFFKFFFSSDNGFESGDGWDVEDEVEIPDSETAEAAEAISEVDFEAICDTARLKVDLQKAQAACETLTEQLMSAEAAKETFEAEAKNCKIEAENARKAKETAMEERCDLAKKHEVLSSYFNQREAELQKQLGTFFSFFFFSFFSFNFSFWNPDLMKKI